MFLRACLCVLEVLCLLACLCVTECVCVFSFRGEEEVCQPPALPTSLPIHGTHTVSWPSTPHTYTVQYCSCCTAPYCSLLYCKGATLLPIHGTHTVRWPSTHTHIHCTVLYCTLLYSKGAAYLPTDPWYCTIMYCTVQNSTVHYNPLYTHSLLALHPHTHSLYCTIMYCTVLYSKGAAYLPTNQQSAVPPPPHTYTVLYYTCCTVPH